MRDDPPEVVPARAADQPAIAAILDEARRWMAGRGIAQWTLPFSDEWIAAKIAADEFWVARLAGEPVAVVRLLWADPLFWGERDDGSAAYVHTLAVRRDRAGCGVGVWLLDWAAAQARARDRRALRLDCAADNRGLCAYYARAGFTARGSARVGSTTVMLFEKILAE